MFAQEPEASADIMCICIIRAGFSWCEAWGQACLWVTMRETVKALGLKIQD